MRPIRVQRVHKTQLLVGGTGDFQADFNDISGFIRADRKAQFPGIGEHEAVTAIGRVNLERAQAFDFNPGIQAVSKGRHVLDLDPLHLAVAAVGHRLDQAAGGFEHQPGLRLGHRQDAAVEQHRGHAHRIGPRHGRGIGRLHDDPGHLRPWILGRHQQVDVAEHPAARLVEYEVAQGFIPGNPARLLPHRGTRWRCHAADNHVADFALGVTTDHMDDFR